MTQLTMETYAEVDAILNLMEDKDIQKIPKNLRKLFKEKKSKDYNKIILTDKPLEEQDLNSETFAILAVLNFNYWCNDDEKKKQLIETYSKNEDLHQKELKEKYNPDNIFKKTILENEPEQNTIEHNITITEVKESILKKCIIKIKNFFHLK